MPKFQPNTNFSMDNPLKKLASTSNLKPSALTKKEFISDYEFKHGKKPPVGKLHNAMGHYVDKKTTNNPVKTDQSGRYMTPNTNFKTKTKTKTTNPDGSSKSKPIDFKNDKAPKTNYKTKFVDDSASKAKSTPKKTTKKKVTFKEAYKKRDMKTYGNLSFDEYKTEAKRQIKHKKDTTVKPKEIGVGGKMTKGKEGSWDAPKSQMKGTVTGPKTNSTTTEKTTKTTKTTKNTLKPDPKNFETLDSAKAKRKSAKKAVRATRKEFGRGSDEVKTAKTKRKAAKQNVKDVKKRDRGGKRTLGGKLAYFLAGPSGRAKMDAKKSAKKSTKTTGTVKKDEKVDLTKKSGKGPLAKKTPMYKKTKYSKANPHPMAGSKNAKGTKVVDTQGNWKRINPVPPKK